MAQYYGCVVIPARVRKPKDKPKVEAAVRVVTMWITAKLRNHTFFSIDEANKEVRRLLIELNNRQMKKLKKSRTELFRDLDKPSLKPLPSVRYEYAEWQKAPVNVDYHVEVDSHFYSVPYNLTGKMVEVRLTTGTVEIFHQNRRVATHQRSYQKGAATTLNEHRPKSHQMYLGWTPASVLEHARNNIGPYAFKVFEQLINGNSHPEKGMKSCIGIISLHRKPDFQDRLEAACKRALAINSASYRSIKSILQSGLDRVPLTDPEKDRPAIDHENIRGSNYYR